MKVVLYTAPACTYCYMIKIFFKKNKIPFEEIDISENAAEMEELAKKTGSTGVPVTFIGNEFVAGYDLEKIKKLLGQ